MERKYYKKINILVYLVLFIAMAIIPLIMRLIDDKYMILLLSFEGIIIVIYILLLYKKIKFVDKNIRKVLKKEVIGIYISILGIVIMSYSEGYLYRGTGKINFFIVIVACMTLIPIINSDEKNKLHIKK